jgi:hypothetical protein
MEIIQKTDEFFICGLNYQKKDLPQLTDSFYKLIYNLLNLSKKTNNKVVKKQIYNILTDIIKMKKMGLNKRVIVLLLNN